jgi:hypothetical protein
MLWSMALSWRQWALVAALAAPIVAGLVVGPIAQDAAYHGFADRRSFGGIPNFGNVASNVAFLLVGLAGMVVAARARVARPSWIAFFAGVALVCFGSACYHLAPDDARLVWDRLPMALAFMALMVALLAEHIDASLERKLLVPALLAGLASVLWWDASGDLRPYLWVQLAPLLVLAVLLAAYPGRFMHRGLLGWGLAFYALAKAAEFADARIYELSSHMVSGHTLKHLIASLAPACVVVMLAWRRPVATGLLKP